MEREYIESKGRLDSRQLNFGVKNLNEGEENGHYALCNNFVAALQRRLDSSSFLSSSNIERTKNILGQTNLN